MQKLDAQIHVWLSDRPALPWDPGYRSRYRSAPSFLQHAGQSNSPDHALAEMATAGVDGAVLCTLGVYGFSNQMELNASHAWPQRFCTVGVVDHLTPDLEQSLCDQTAQGLRGVRIPGLRDAAAWEDGTFNPLLQLCNSLGLSVMLPSVNPALARYLPQYPKIFFFLNHLGTGLAPPIVGYGHPHPFADLDNILDLSLVSNLGLKLTGVPALSQQAYPFRDIWGPVRQVLSAYGAERLAWGSDYTRTSGLHSYHDATHYLEEIGSISDKDLRLIMGGTIAERLDWFPSVVHA